MQTIPSKARALLRTWQGMSAALPTAGVSLVTDAALKYLDVLTQFEPTGDPDAVRRGAFYNRARETKRIARAAALIRRVAPVSLEDPNYLAFLAYQAASVELAYEHLPDGLAGRDAFSRFLLGTVHNAEINALAVGMPSGGYTIVVLNSGLVDFVYQAAKAVIEALAPIRPDPDRSRVTATFDLKVIEARLRSDPTPADRLYRTLEAYFFHGYPRASAFEKIPDAYGPPLALLVDMAERWMIGHEYGHGLSPAMENVPPEVNPSRAREHLADMLSTVATAFSAAELDGVPPEFSIGGAIFALACLDVRRRAYSILRTGSEQWANVPSPTHPLARDRADSILRVFRQYFDVDYFPSGEFDLRFVLRDSPPQPHSFSSEHAKRAYAFANVLQTIWLPVKERLLMMSGQSVSFTPCGNLKSLILHYTTPKPLRNLLQNEDCLS